MPPAGPAGRAVSADADRRIPRASSPRPRVTVRQGWCGLVLLLAAGAAGCGKGLPASVSGTVTLDGRPLTTGLVTFLPAASGPVAYGAIGPQGRYSIQTGSKGGLEPGDYSVTVAANAPPPAAPPPAGGPKYAEPMLLLVTPRRYADKQTTPLKATVSPGSQTIDFALESQ
jgi:hypothetical protein